MEKSWTEKELRRFLSWAVEDMLTAHKENNAFYMKLHAELAWHWALELGEESIND